MALTQIVGVFVGLPFLFLTPPAIGQMLLVPLAGQSTGDVLTAAVGRGARLVSAGPLPSSLIVHGERARLARLLANEKILLIAVPAAGCAGEDGDIRV